MQINSDAHLVIVKARLLDTQDALGELRQQMAALCETAGVANPAELLKWLSEHRSQVESEPHSS